MSNVQRRCANCKHWDWFDVDYGDFPEDDCGSCKIDGEVMYGDEPACDNFVMAYRGDNIQPARKNKKPKHSKKTKKMRLQEDDE